MIRTQIDVKDGLVLVGCQPGVVTLFRMIRTRMALSMRLPLIRNIQTRMALRMRLPLIQKTQARMALRLRLSLIRTR